jgi:hypothetical protein
MGSLSCVHANACCIAPLPCARTHPPTPRYVQRVHCDIDAKAAATQSTDFSERSHVLKWRFKRINGGQEATLRARLTLERPYGPQLRTEVGVCAAGVSTVPAVVCCPVPGALLTPWRCGSYPAQHPQHKPPLAAHTHRHHV